MTDHKGPLPVLYQDPWLVAVNKPSGMLVHRSDCDRTGTDVVVQKLRDQLGCFIYPVHRLDRATSGILLLSLSSEMAALMGALFANRQVAKTYRALVRGYCEDRATIDAPLMPPRRRSGTRPAAQAQPALTAYETLRRFEVPLPSAQHPTTRCSLVRACPRTGRFHQIRRHFNRISHPVLGDTSHGDSRMNRLFRQELGMTRLMLAAVELCFVHPLTEQPIRIRCEPDASFHDVIDRLERA